MEEVKKKETRGRPKTGQKKGVSFRIEEKLFEEYEKKAQEESGVSIHTFIKDNLEFLFKGEPKNKKRNIFYSAPPEISKHLKELNNNNVELINMFFKSLIERQLEKDILDKIRTTLDKQFDEIYFERLYSVEDGEEVKDFIFPEEKEYIQTIETFLNLKQALDHSEVTTSLLSDELFYFLKKIIESKFFERKETEENLYKIILK